MLRQVSFALIHGRFLRLLLVAAVIGIVLPLSVTKRIVVKADYETGCTDPSCGTVTSTDSYLPPPPASDGGPSGSNGSGDASPGGAKNDPNRFTMVFNPDTGEKTVSGVPGGPIKKVDASALKACARGGAAGGSGRAVTGAVERPMMHEIGAAGVRFMTGAQSDHPQYSELAAPPSTNTPRPTEFPDCRGANPNVIDQCRDIQANRATNTAAANAVYGSATAVLVDRANINATSTMVSRSGGGNPVAVNIENMVETGTKAAALRNSTVAAYTSTPVGADLTQAALQYPGLARTPTAPVPVQQGMSQPTIVALTAASVYVNKTLIPQQTSDAKAAISAATAYARTIAPGQTLDAKQANTYATDIAGTSAAPPAVQTQTRLDFCRENAAAKGCDAVNSDTPVQTYKCDRGYFPGTGYPCTKAEYDAMWASATGTPVYAASPTNTGADLTQAAQQVPQLTGDAKTAISNATAYQRTIAPAQTFTARQDYLSTTISDLNSASTANGFQATTNAVLNPSGTFQPPVQTQNARIATGQASINAQLTALVATQNKLVSPTTLPTQPPNQTGTTVAKSTSSAGTRVAAAQQSNADPCKDVVPSKLMRKFGKLSRNPGRLGAGGGGGAIGGGGGSGTGGGNAVVYSCTDSEGGDKAAAFLATMVREGIAADKMPKFVGKLNGSCTQTPPQGNGPCEPSAGATGFVFDCPQDRELKLSFLGANAKVSISPPPVQVLKAPFPDGHTNGELLAPNVLTISPAPSWATGGPDGVWSNTIEVFPGPRYQSGGTASVAWYSCGLDQHMSDASSGKHGPPCDGDLINYQLGLREFRLAADSEYAAPIGKVEPYCWTFGDELLPWRNLAATISCGSTVSHTYETASHPDAVTSGAKIKANGPRLVFGDNGQGSIAAQWDKESYQATVGTFWSVQYTRRYSIAHYRVRERTVTTTTNSGASATVAPTTAPGGSLTDPRFMAYIDPTATPAATSSGTTTTTTTTYHIERIADTVIAPDWKTFNVRPFTGKGYITSGKQYLCGYYEGRMYCQGPSPEPGSLPIPIQESQVSSMANGNR